MIVTIGHSTLSADDFKLVIHEAPTRVRLLIDVRSHPTSHLEHFRKEHLSGWVKRKLGIPYVWWPDLGGWGSADAAYIDTMALKGVNVAAYCDRKFPKHVIAQDRNGPAGRSWTNQGLYDYAWFTSIRRFRRAVRGLIDVGSRDTVAIMCAEVLWWKCHRSMIADCVFHDTHGSLQVVHLQPRVTTHGGDMAFERLQRYPAAVVRAWKKGGL